MYSKIFITAGILAWFLTFLVGFFILAPSTDDGYYVIAALGTAIKGSPGFWIGNEFAPSFFLPTAFTYIYGVLLKLTMVLGFDFGPFGFRVYQFLFILMLPVVSAWMLRRLFPGDHAIRLLMLLSLLSVTYFVQSAATVRPEVLGILLFVGYLALRKSNSPRLDYATFLLALSGTMHPIFMLLAFTVFAASIFRRYKRTGLSDSKQWFGTLAAFALPYAGLVLYYAFNLSEYRQQIGGRAGILSADFLASPKFIGTNLLFWNDPSGIEFGLYGGYPAVAFFSTMLISTALVISKRKQLWGDENLWVVWPVVVVQWVIFFGLPTYLPYLAVSSFLSSLVIVLLWQSPLQLVARRNTRLLFVGACVGLALIFIAFHAGKFVLISDERLTPTGLHSAISPLLEDGETKLYTNAARLIPPLIDNFSVDDDVQLNFLYLDPDCLPPHLMGRANEHMLTTLIDAFSDKDLWGINLADSNTSKDGAISFVTKGARSTITLTPEETAYSDKKNLITSASSVSVELAQPGTCD